MAAAPPVEPMVNAPTYNAPPAKDAPRFVAPDFVHQSAETAIPASLKKVNWVHFVLLTATPLLALYGLLTVPLRLPTAIWAVVYYAWTGLGITAGYHRYWAHKSYDAGKLFRWFLLIGGTGAVEGSIRWWSRGHRQHHRYTDTIKDPYSARKGMLWAHIGWMLNKEDAKNRGAVDISDLDKDWMVRWQHRNYPWLSMLMGFVLPTFVAGLGWGDWVGGYFFAGVLRLVFVHHATFCVNSLAHWLGEATFTDRLTPRNHIITAFVTLGEGYHNFHHEFPHDYRNAIEWYQYDPTKWLIRGASMLGLTWNLKTMPMNEIMKGVVHQKEKRLQREKEELDYGPKKEQLPEWSWDEFQSQHISGRKLVCVSNVIYDVEDFLPHHPGGRHLIKLNLGKDVTADFNGRAYWHSWGARHLLQGMAVARLDVPTGEEVDGMAIEQRLFKEVEAAKAAEGGKAKAA
ncbi:stearoyl-CoA desaturase [Hyaloraphidium curvatum]|nr:stearoyl-CoA desaturase [Hyaloraphidium curvatum]